MLLLLIGSLSTGCSGVKVGQDYWQGQDFSRYTYYRWQPQPPVSSRDIRANSPLLQQRFRQAIDAALAQRGYRQAATADFLVSYEYEVRSRFDPDPFDTSVAVGFGRYHNYGAVGIGSGYGYRQYDVGILAIDFTDARTGGPIWRGTGSQLNIGQTNPQRTGAYVNRLVDAILAQFPPQ